jgi:hypothetical protein
MEHSQFQAHGFYIPLSQEDEKRKNEKKIGKVYTPLQP